MLISYIDSKGNILLTHSALIVLCVVFEFLFEKTPNVLKTLNMSKTSNMLNLLTRTRKLVRKCEALL